MNNKKINIAIAEACGWKWIQTNFEAKSGLIGTDSPHSGNIPYQATNYPSNRHLPTYGKAIPDYCNDLNAMHEAEKMLTSEQVTSYVDLLEFMNEQWATPAFGTAAQRAEAFLRTLEKWEVVIAQANQEKARFQIINSRLPARLAMNGRLKQKD